jgi:cholesterol transport system auxiliary component
VRLKPQRLAAGVVALAAVALTGCVSLFPKSEPAQLYRFGPSETTAGVASSDLVPMGLAAVDFAAASGGDRIMAVTGSEVAYIAAARWATPARTMFTESLRQTFARKARVAGLIDRSEMRASNLMLSVDVSAFEVRYENGRNAAPVAVVSLDAKIVRFPDRVVISHRAFEARQPASDNRVGAIVQAIDAANNQVLGEVVSWADASAR